MNKKLIKKIILIILGTGTALAVIIVILQLLYNTVYGTFSIPHWMRPTHEAKAPVEKYHSNLDFYEPLVSRIPRMDIFMDENYLLSRNEYSGCTVQISNAGKYDLRGSQAEIRIRGNSTQYADKKPFKLKFSEKISLFG